MFDDAETRGETLFEAMYELGDPTWAAVQGLFLANGCASNFCHGNAPGSGNLGDLGNYDLAYDEMLVEGVFCLPTGFTQRVVANDVANSFLVAKLEGTQDCGLSMPLGGMLLDPAIIDVVKAWINSGALKN